MTEHPLDDARRSATDHPGRGQLVWAVTFGVAIAVQAYAFGFSAGRFEVLVVAQALMPLVAVAAFVTCEGVRHLNGRAYALAAGLTLVLWLLLLPNVVGDERWDASPATIVAHVIGLSSMLVAAAWAVTNLSAERIFATTAWALTPLIMAVLWISNADAGLVRSTPLDIHPNWWGELSLAFALCLLCLRGHFRWPLMSAAFLLVYRVQSRSSLLGICAGILVYAGMVSLPRWKGNPRAIAAVAGAVLAAVFLGATVSEESDVAQFVMHKVLLVDDQHRGVGTGLTARMDGYQEALAAFYENPVFGRGLDTLADVHNGYLRLAGEGGLILLCGVMWLTIAALVRALKGGYTIAASVLVAYLVYVAFQPRMLNMNVASVVFFVALLSSFAPRPGCALTPRIQSKCA